MRPFSSSVRPEPLDQARDRLVEGQTMDLTKARASTSSARTVFLKLYTCQKIFLALILLAAGCNRLPTERLTDPAPEGAVPDANVSTWVLFEDEARTGGGAYLFPEADNQELVIGTDETAFAGKKSIRYLWNGGPVPDPTFGNQHAFAGFGLIVSNDGTGLPTAAPRNLTDAGFTKITFWAKGSLSENTILRAGGPGEGTGASTLPRLDIARSELTGDWKKFTITGIPDAQWRNVKEYVLFVFVYTQPTATTNPGQGGVVFIDQIAYEK